MIELLNEVRVNSLLQPTCLFDKFDEKLAIVTKIIDRLKFFNGDGGSSV